MVSSSGGPPGAGSPVARAEPITLTALIVLVGTMMSIIFHYAAGSYFDLGYPWTTFLYAPGDRFMDFLNMHELAREYGRGGESTLIYSPAMHFLMRALAVLPGAVALVLVDAVFLAAATGTAYAATARLGDPLLRWLHASVLVLLSYPVLFAIDRGNLEMVVFVLLAVWAYLHYAKHSPWAWVALGGAIACKYYAVTLLVLPLLDRRYRQAVYAIVTAVAATIIGAVGVSTWAGLSPLATLRHMFGTLGGHVDLSESVFTLPHSHSLWSLLQLVNRLTGYSLSGISHLRSLYVAVVLVLFAFVLYNLITHDYHPWARLTLLMVCATLLPFESGDYTLVQLLLPLALFSVAAAKTRSSYAIAALFAGLLIPLDYFYIPFDGVHWSVSISLFVYPVLLLALAGTALQTGIRRKAVATTTAFDG